MNRFTKLVYVAGPITFGDLTHNVRQAHEAGMALMMAGVGAIVPHGSCFWGSKVWRGRFKAEACVAPATHADWLGMDLLMVSRCDALLRLPGASPGADQEVARAQELNLPVFHSAEEVIRWAIKEMR